MLNSVTPTSRCLAGRSPPGPAVAGPVHLPGTLLTQGALRTELGPLSPGLCARERRNHVGLLGSLRCCFLGALRV